MTYLFGSKKWFTLDFSSVCFTVSGLLQYLVGFFPPSACFNFNVDLQRLFKEMNLLFLSAPTKKSINL